MGRRTSSAKKNQRNQNVASKIASTTTLLNVSPTTTKALDAKIRKIQKKAAASNKDHIEESTDEELDTFKTDMLTGFSPSIRKDSEENSPCGTSKENPTNPKPNQNRPDEQHDNDNNNNNNNMQEKKMGEDSQQPQDVEAIKLIAAMKVQLEFLMNQNMKLKEEHEAFNQNSLNNNSNSFIIECVEKMPEENEKKMGENNQQPQDIEARKQIEAMKCLMDCLTNQNMKLKKEQEAFKINNHNNSNRIQSDLCIKSDSNSKQRSNNILNNLNNNMKNDIDPSSSSSTGKGKVSLLESSGSDGEYHQKGTAMRVNQWAVDRYKHTIEQVSVGDLSAAKISQRDLDVDLGAAVLEVEDGSARRAADNDEHTIEQDRLGNLSAVRIRQRDLDVDLGAASLEVEDRSDLRVEQNTQSSDLDLESRGVDPIFMFGSKTNVLVRSEKLVTVGERSAGMAVDGTEDGTDFMKSSKQQVNVGGFEEKEATSLALSEMMSDGRGNPGKSVFEKERLVNAWVNKGNNVEGVFGNGDLPWSSLLKPKNLEEIQVKFEEPSANQQRGQAIPSDDIANEGSVEFANTLVGYFLETKLPYSLVYNTAQRYWSKTGLKEILATDSGFFFFQFNSREQCNVVLEGGPWHVVGHPLVLKHWHCGLKLKKEAIRILPMWVNIYDVPLEYWNSKGLSCIGSTIGRPLHVDKITASRKRISYARMCIEIDADEPFLEEVELIVKNPITKLKESLMLKLEYQWKPKRCGKCKVFGHDCEEKEMKQRQDSKIEKKQLQQPADKKGVWQVKQKGKNVALTTNVVETTSKPNASHGIGDTRRQNKEQKIDKKTKGVGTSQPEFMQRRNQFQVLTDSDTDGAEDLEDDDDLLQWDEIMNPTSSVSIKQNHTRNHNFGVIGRKSYRDVT